MKAVVEMEVSVFYRFSGVFSRSAAPCLSVSFFCHNRI